MKPYFCSNHGEDKLLIKPMFGPSGALDWTHTTIVGRKCRALHVRHGHVKPPGLGRQTTFVHNAVRCVGLWTVILRSKEFLMDRCSTTNVDDLLYGVKASLSLYRHPFANVSPIRKKSKTQFGWQAIQQMNPTEPTVSISSTRPRPSARFNEAACTKNETKTRCA